MGVLNIEIVGGLCIVYLMTRLDNVYSFAHQLLRGIKFFLPPSDQDIEQLQPIVHKRMKKPARQKTLLEKIELLNLQAAAIRPGLLFKQPYWDVYDFMLFSVIVVVLNHIWCELYTCFSGNFSGHAWPFWVTMFSLMLCVNAGVQSTAVVGFQLPEGRYALGCGVAAYMAATMVLNFYTDGFKLFAQQLQTFSQHFLAHSINAERVIVAASVAVSALVIGAIVGCMMIPAYRFSRLHLELLGAKDTTSARIRLSVDILLPLLAGLAWIFGSQLPLAQSTVQLVQVALTVLFVCSRISLFRDHIQQFLLGVRATLVPELAKEVIDGKEIQDRVMVRFKYIAIAASEYLAFPLAVVCLLALLHSKGTLDFGLCSLARTLLGFGGEQSADEMPAEAQAATGGEGSSQTLMEILDAHQDMATTVAALKVLFKTIGNQVVFPPQLFGDLVAIALGMTLTCWFAIYGSCMLYWKFGGRVLSSVLNAVTGSKRPKSD